VRLHASRIPLCIPVEQIRSIFAEFGQLVDGVELRPMKASRSGPSSSRSGHSCSSPLGWSIVKYADYAAASRAVDALNGRLRFNPDSGEILRGGAGGGGGGGGSEDVASADSGGAGRSLSSKERGLEWANRNRQARAENVEHYPALKLWYAQLNRATIRNKFRVTAFRIWLINTFGLPVLRLGSGVPYNFYCYDYYLLDIYKYICLSFTVMIVIYLTYIIIIIIYLTYLRGS